MKKLIVSILCLILVIFIGLFVANQFNQDIMSVKTSVVKRGSISAYVSAAGNVINREELTINSPVLAQILKLGATEGDRVIKGQMLVSLDDRESTIQIDKARAALTLADQNQAEAKRDWTRLQQILEVGGESSKTVENAELHWQAMQKERALAKEELYQARVRLEQFQLAAPIAGTITTRTARVGVWVKPGDPLFRLAPAGLREIEVKLDAGDSAVATLGKTVLVTSDAFPGKEWHEKITWIAPITNKEGASNSLSMHISLSQDAPPLVLGQQVDVKISTASRDKILKIPSSAIISKQGKPLVAIIVNDRVHLISLSTGIDDLAFTEVTSGLQEGQQIVLPEGKTLHEGDKVKIVVDRVT